MTAVSPTAMGGGMPSSPFATGQVFFGEWCLYGVIALVECAALFLHLTSAMTSGDLLVLHAGMCAIVALLLIRRSRDDEQDGLSTIAGLAIMLGGPPGAIGAALLSFARGRSRAPAAIDDEWRRQLLGHYSEERSDTLFDDIRDGRAVSVGESTPTSLSRMLREGSLPEKQMALGAIAGRFGSEFHHLLDAAIRDSSPPVRVQAAAVLTKLRTSHRSRLHEILQHCRNGFSDLPSAIAGTTELLAIIQVDPLDARQRGEALATVEGAIAALVASNPDEPRLPTALLLLETGFIDQAVLLLRQIGEPR